MIFNNFYEYLDNLNVKIDLGEADKIAYYLFEPEPHYDHPSEHVSGVFSYLRDIIEDAGLEDMAALLAYINEGRKKFAGLSDRLMYMSPEELEQERQRVMAQIRKHIERNSKEPDDLFD